MHREQGTDIEVTESRAKSELVARGCELVLTDGEAIKELAERNRGLFGKIKAKIIEFTDSIINACKEILGKDGNIKNDVISKEAMQMKEYAEKLRTLWNEAVGAAGESNVTVTNNVNEQNMLRENYKKEIDEWYNNTNKEQRLKSLGRFLIGRTSDVLKSINVKDYNIYFGKSKIQKILNKHQDMDIGFIKQVPEILEKPIVIMDSVTRSDSLVILGDLISKEGEPVIVSLLVDPKNKSGIIEDFGIITSAYGNNLNNLQKLINNSNIRYIEPDKKRTNKWLSVLRLQLPSSTTKYGSVNKITNEYQNVNDILKQDRNSNGEVTLVGYDYGLMKGKNKYLIFCKASEINKWSNRKIYEIDDSMWFSYFNLDKDSNVLATDNNYDMEIEFYTDSSDVLKFYNSMKKRIIDEFCNE